MPGVKFMVKKQCVNCFCINDFENNRCSQCGFLFIRPANLIEEIRAKKQLEEMKLRGGN